MGYAEESGLSPRGLTPLTFATQLKCAGLLSKCHKGVHFIALSTILYSVRGATCTARLQRGLEPAISASLQCLLLVGGTVSLQFALGTLSQRTVTFTNTTSTRNIDTGKHSDTCPRKDPVLNLCHDVRSKVRLFLRLHDSLR